MRKKKIWLSCNWWNAKTPVLPGIVIFKSENAVKMNFTAQKAPKNMNSLRLY